MLKKISLFIIFISLFIIMEVHATTYVDSFNEHYMWIPNEYVNKTKNGSTKYQQMSMMVRKSDNSFVYCIEPGKSLDESTKFNGYDFSQNEKANLTSSQWDRIKLLAYYGYGYKGHTDIKWYVITQYMIWQTNNLGYDIYFTNKLNGEKVIKYVDEMKELDELVNTQYKIPMIENGKLNMLSKDTKEFIDKNNVIDNFNISSSNNINAKNINGNLLVESLNDKNGYVIFTKEEKRFNRKPVVYIDSNSQNLILPGDLADVTYRIDTNYEYGSASLNLKDYDTSTNIPSGSATLKGAGFGLYENDILIEKKYTDENGNINFESKLSKGNYNIKELNPSEGYNPNNSEYNFNIDNSNKNQNVVVYTKVIKEKYNIFKYLEYGADMLLPEENVEFEIFDENDNYIKSVNTDSNGNASFDLVYGKYFLKQNTTTYGYNRINDIELVALKNDNVNNLFFRNTKLKYRIKVNVKDELNNPVCDENVYFEDNLEKTDKNGIVIFDKDVDYGKYEVKVNNEIIDINIDENTKYFVSGDKRIVEIEIIKKKIENEKVEIKELDNLQNSHDEMLANDNEKIIPEDNLLTVNLENDGMSDFSDIELTESNDRDFIEDSNRDYKMINLPNTLDNDYTTYILMIALFFTIKKIAI